MLYMFIQNDVAEYIIQITENFVQAMIKKLKLLIKFWVKTAQINVYFCNYIAVKFIINDKQIILKKIFIDIKLFINHLCIWECKCYFYVNLKSLLKKIHNKFMNREWVRIFIKYIEEITKQYLLWISNIKYIIKSYTVKFAENEKKNCWFLTSKTDFKHSFKLKIY